MVERCLAKANVASSNLVFRSNEKTAPSARFQTSLKSITFRLVFFFIAKNGKHFRGASIELSGICRYMGEGAVNAKGDACENNLTKIDIFIII